MADEQVNKAALAKQKTTEEEQAPSWFKNARSLKVRSFFFRSIANGTEPTQAEKQNLLNYLWSTFTYMDQDDKDGDHRNFIRDSIAPFVNSLTREKLISPIREGYLTEAIGNWTLENILIRHLITYSKAGGRGVIGALDLLSKHSKGITITSGVFLLFVGAHYVDTALFDSYLSDTATSSAIFAFKSGPITSIMTALTAWAISPTTEWVTTWMNRIAGKPAALVNRIFNRLQPNIGSDEAQADMNLKPRVSNGQTDGYNFGGLTGENQSKLWLQFLDNFTEMQAHASKLLRGQQGSGRNFVQSGITDLQVSANSVFTMDSNLTIHQERAEHILSIYESNFLNRGETEKIEKLEGLYERFQAGCTSAWAEELTEQQMEALKVELDSIANQLLALGVQRSHMKKLWNIQVSMARAGQALATTINVNELKRFLNAETNRNAVESVRVIEQTTYDGYGLQHYAHAHQGTIRRQHARMNIKNDGELLPDCNSVLGTPVQAITAIEKR